MAALHATFWNAGPEIDLIPASNRLMELSPWLVATEAELGSDAIIPPLVGRVGPPSPNWRRRAGSWRSWPATPAHWSPRWSAPPPRSCTATGSSATSAPMIAAGPSSSTGSRPVRAPCSDLAWYLAINSARLPHSKEAAAEAYRNASEALGVDTEPWWDDQLRLSLLGGLVQFGWEKALGGQGPELDWWLERAAEGARLLAS